jgi:hypothetical protein
MTAACSDVSWAVDDDWTLRIEDYVGRLQDAHLIPPINAIEVGTSKGQPVLWLDVADAPSKDLSARVRAVLAGVPHQIRHVPLLSGGRRRGVNYA